MATYNTYNTNLRVVYFRDMRIYHIVSIPRHKVKKGEPTMMCSLDWRNIHFFLVKDHLQQNVPHTNTIYIVQKYHHLQI